jgi:hypothetical protein
MPDGFCRDFWRRRPQSATATSSTASTRAADARGGSYPSALVLGVFTSTQRSAAASQAIRVGTLDLASVSNTLRSLSYGVRPGPRVFSLIVRRKRPLIARRAVHHRASPPPCRLSHAPDQTHRSLPMISESDSYQGQVAVPTEVAVHRVPFAGLILFLAESKLWKLAASTPGLLGSRSTSSFVSVRIQFLPSTSV